jgi:hypothetical protein
MEAASAPNRRHPAFSQERSQALVAAKAVASHKRAWSPPSRDRLIVHRRMAVAPVRLPTSTSALGPAPVRRLSREIFSFLFLPSISLFLLSASHFGRFARDWQGEGRPLLS